MLSSNGILVASTAAPMEVLRDVLAAGASRVMERGQDRQPPPAATAIASNAGCGFVSTGRGNGLEPIIVEFVNGQPAILDRASRVRLPAGVHQLTIRPLVTVDYDVKTGKQFSQYSAGEGPRARPLSVDGPRGGVMPHSAQNDMQIEFTVEPNRVHRLAGHRQADGTFVVVERSAMELECHVQ